MSYLASPKPVSEPKKKEDEFGQQLRRVRDTQAQERKRIGRKELITPLMKNLLGDGTGLTIK